MTAIPTHTHRDAPLGRRGLALAVDAFIGAFPLVGLMGLLLAAWVAFLGGPYWGWSGVEEALADVSQTRFYTLFAVWLIGVLASFTWFVAHGLLRDSFGKGQSWGKRLFGLRTIRADLDRPCRRRDSVLRNLPGVVTVIAAFLLPFVGWILLAVEPVAVLASPDRLRIGDRWAGTRVVSA